MASSLTRFLQRTRVPLGFVFAAVYLIFSDPGGWSLPAGLAVAALGVAVRAWACGHLRKSSELDVSGPYAFTRNPLYLGTIVIAVGFGVASGVWWLALMIAVFIGSIYFPVMHVEAEVLDGRLGDEYKAYADNVPMLLPRPTPWRKSDRSFDFQLYLKNGEYQAALGFGAAAAILILKATYLG